MLPLLQLVLTLHTPSRVQTFRHSPRLERQRHTPLTLVAIDSPATREAVTNTEAKFPRTWVPLASTFELDPERPTPVRFLGNSYVCWMDNDGEWRVVDDACPHRLAPLSEGRIDRKTNTLECAYHGWAFEPSGACARIPQANAAVANEATLSSPRACVASSSSP